MTCMECRLTALWRCSVSRVHPGVHSIVFASHFHGRRCLPSHSLEPQLALRSC